ncbi:MAG: hypothetical protein HY015_08435 [Bacteroidetes bacterium]|nr:hypothetical protein [Bacteroidota bacterium]MBI3482983.1 hypothetical protein [Bacteroidota bacterium]
MKKFFTVSLLFVSFGVFAQDDLMKELEKGQKPEINYVGQTFKGTRIINGQSVESKGKGELEFIFAHRFDKINTGSYNAWGFDGFAVVRLGLEYGITDRLGVSIGRNFNTANKMVDAYVRYKVARQSTGAKSFPVTITAIGTVTYQAFPNAADATANSLALPSTADRMAYVVEVPIARKFSSKFSAQVTPIFVHRNAVNKSFENNDDYAVAVAARYKISRSVSLVGEYCDRLNANSSSPFYNSAGFGFDIETGGHVFQLIFTNSLGLNPNTIVTQTDGNINKGDIRFGFNITRTFQLTKRK